MTESPPPPDDPDFVALLQEIPLLYRARGFAEQLIETPLFVRLGEPLDARDRRLARAFLDGLGFPDAEAAALGNWEDAADAALALDVDPAGWEAEELMRAAATDAVLARLDEEALRTGLTLIAEKAGEAAKRAAEEADSLWDIEDAGLLNAAAGGFVQAAHTAALAMLAADDDVDDVQHPFLDRFALFGRGRWPIGLAGLTYNVL